MPRLWNELSTPPRLLKIKNQGRQPFFQQRPLRNSPSTHRSHAGNPSAAPPDIYAEANAAIDFSTATESHTTPEFGIATPAPPGSNAPCGCSSPCGYTTPCGLDTSEFNAATEFDTSKTDTATTNTATTNTATGRSLAVRTDSTRIATRCPLPLHLHPSSRNFDTCAKTADVRRHPDL